MERLFRLDSMSYDSLIASLSHSIGLQEKCTQDWHVQEPAGAVVDVAATTSTKDMHVTPSLELTLANLILTQHLQNFRLWHVEDIARRKDVDATIIADCKTKIDTLNQVRNDYMEKIDAFFTEFFLSLAITYSEPLRYHSETIGMIIDRLSILALKKYHMHEETVRTSATNEHKQQCSEKLQTLRVQRSLLTTALFELLEEYRNGVKHPFVYRQHKMYNDPNLNPQLYTK